MFIPRQTCRTPLATMGRVSDFCSFCPRDTSAPLFSLCPPPSTPPQPPFHRLRCGLRTSGVTNTTKCQLLDCQRAWKRPSTIVWKIPNSPQTKKPLRMGRCHSMIPSRLDSLGQVDPNDTPEPTRHQQTVIKP